MNETPPAVADAGAADKGGSVLPDALAYQRSRHIALAIMFAAGASLTMLALLVPNSPHTDKLPELALGALGYPAAALLVLGGRRLPGWTYHLMLAVGIMIVSTGIYFGGGGGPAIAAAFFYVWVSLFAFAYFRWPVACGHVAFALTAYAVVVALSPPDGAAAVYVLIAGTAVTAAGVVAMLRRQLVVFAVTDSLTKLPNRHAFREALAREMARAARNRAPLSLVMLDLDGLKQVNDERGHAAGDALLVTAAIGWKRALRRSDVLVRYGGDEFAMILPDTPAAEAARAVTRLRDASPGVAFSAGIAAYDPHDSLVSFVDRADSDLYAQKRKAAQA